MARYRISRKAIRDIDDIWYSLAQQSEAAAVGHTGQAVLQLRGFCFLFIFAEVLECTPWLRQNNSAQFTIG
jgi:hypothetical protein